VEGKLSEVSKPWLRSFDWDAVTLINQRLCEAKSALHQPTSDGHEPAMKLRESRFSKSMDLSSVFELCRECHRLAPFCFFNGNTFAAIAKEISEPIARSVAPRTGAVFLSAAVHFVAGVLRRDELRAALDAVDNDFASRS
jgi:hypothetical protein